MKFLPLLIIFYGVIFITSCNNNKTTTSDSNSSNLEDSTRKADSIKQENALRDEREQYRAYLQKRIDSMRSEEQNLDKAYAKKSDKDREKWIERRDRINSRIDRLNQRKNDVGTVAKDDWSKFKLDTDTAMTNLKTDWNNMLEKMKVK